MAKRFRKTFFVTIQAASKQGLRLQETLLEGLIKTLNSVLKTYKANIREVDIRPLPKKKEIQKGELFKEEKVKEKRKKK